MRFLHRSLYTVVVTAAFVSSAHLENGAGGALAAPAARGGNLPPDAPVITEPRVEDQVVSYGDVHMETSAFADPDPGDSHVCSDWEIWRVNEPSPNDLAWAVYCIAGVERVHAHLRDGTFENGHAGRASLYPDTEYVLRTRHKDSSGDAATQWSPWSERRFRTSNAAVVAPLQLDDVADDVSPRWTDGAGQEIFLPSAPPLPGTAAFVRLESPEGAPLLELRGRNGKSNQVVNAAGLAEHATVRLRLSGGSAAGMITLPASTLAFTDHSGEAHVVYLPSVALSAGGPGSDVILWISAGGATYYGEAGQSEPDFTRLARSQALPWAIRQPGFRLDVVATGFQLPVNIAFVPNAGPEPEAPLFYVSELFGTIKVVTRGGVVSDYATNLLNYTAFTAFGLTGIAVDPVSGDVFAAYVYDSHDPPGLYVPRVVRLHSTDGGRTASSQTTVLDMPGEEQGSSHQISTIAIIDQKLMVNMGDGFFTETAQILDFFRGKILRVNLDGSAPADNPFYNAADGISARDYVFAAGFRNPFGGAWRASDNSYYEVENGPATDRFAKVERGRNYLWDGTEESMHEGALYTWFHAHAPTNIAFTQPQTFGGSLFPPEKMDHAFVAESGPTGLVGPQFLGKRISEFVLGPGGELVDGPRPLIEYDGAGVATVVALAAGPDGLYFSDFFKDDAAIDPFPTERGSNILRVRFVGEAEFTSSVRSGNLPLTVQFTDVSDVVNPTGWQWSFGDGGTSSEQHPVHTYTQAGVYDVRMAVTGAGGLLVEHKACLIRAGAPTRVALLGASPLPAGDQAVVNHLTARGNMVQVYDAASLTRPSADQLGAMFDVALIGASGAGAVVGAEFRDAAIPVVAWDPAVLGTNRIPICDGTSTFTFQGSVNITGNRHPITLGLPLGTIPVFSPEGTMSFANGNLAEEASYPATRVGALGDQAIAVADVDTTLLGGHVTPARRVFLFFGSGFGGANATAMQILDQAVDWASQGIQPAIVTHPADQVLPIGATVQFSVQARGSGPLDVRWHHDGAPLIDGGRISGAHSGVLTIQGFQAGDAGAYFAVVSNECATATSNSATLGIGCACDWNASGTLNSQDFFDFIAALFLLNADYNHDGVTNSQDFFDFMACFFGGC